VAGFMTMKLRTETELRRIKTAWGISEDGVLFWISGRMEGKPVGVQTTKKGHQLCVLSVEGKLVGYSVGQVAWYLYTGEWASGEVDHIDADPKNHRKENLRMATRQQQCMNRAAGRAGRLNKGVYKRDYGDKWSAQVWVNGKCKCLGTYDSEAKAVQARIEATKMLHGDFANIKSYAGSLK
jgi:hypothetical protein